MNIRVTKPSWITIATVVLGLLPLLINGCQESPPTPEKKNSMVIKLKAHPVKDLGRHPTFKEPSADKPSPTLSVPTVGFKGIDPFVPLVQITSTTNPTIAEAETPDPSIDNSPLSKIDLDRLRVTAIIRTDASRLALLEEFSGRGHIIQKGARIGTRGARVIGILSDGIVVEEVPGDLNGKNQPRRQTIKIRPDNNEKF
jgi:Tfp pilus assembly protein PilP